MPDQLPFFSVVMSSYNNVDTIDAAIRGVLNQDYSNYDLWLVSDGANDGTIDIMRYYAARNSNIHLLEFKENIGKSMAINFAVARAQGEYIAIADADDIWIREKLSKQYHYLSQNPSVDVLGGQIIRFGSWGTAREATMNPILGVEISKWLSHNRMAMNNPTVVFRKAAFISIGGYRGFFRRNEDLDLFIRMNERGFKFHNINDVLAMYRTSSPIQDFSYWLRTEFGRQEIILANSHRWVRFFPLVRLPIILFSFVRLAIVFIKMKVKLHNVG